MKNNTIKEGNTRYDESIKEWYLELVKEKSPLATYNTTKTYISSVEEWENRFEKSLTEFTLTEIQTMFRGFRFTSEASYYTVLSILTKYTDFACTRLAKPVCQIRLIDTNDVEGIVNNMAVENKYITREDLFSRFKENELRAEYNRDETDDKVIKLTIALLFEGIRGKDYQDLINLRINSVEVSENDSEDKRIYIKKDLISVKDERVWDLINQVKMKKDMLHFKKDGSVGKVTLTEKSSLLITRVVANKGKPPKVESPDDEYYEEREFTSHALKVRLKNTVDELKLPYLTGTSIYVSGVAERADRWLRERELETDYGTVRDYLDYSKEKIGIAGLISALEHLYKR